MLKRPITYTDFNDNTVTEDFYFNITKSELIELEMTYKEGFSDTLQRIIAEEDKQALINEFKKIVLMAYGVKSPDGKRFEKSDELRTQFSQTAAYNALFLELALDATAAAKFINAVMPQDLAQQADQDKPTGPPVSMAAPTSSPSV